MALPSCHRVLLHEKLQTVHAISPVIGDRPQTHLTLDNIIKNPVGGNRTMRNSLVVHGLGSGEQDTKPI